MSLKKMMEKGQLIKHFRQVVVGSFVLKQKLRMAEGDTATANDQDMTEDKKEEIEPMDHSGEGTSENEYEFKGEHTEDYQKLLDYGLNEKVSNKLDEIFISGKLAYADLDERALDALKEFPTDGALNVLKQFLDSSLEHVSNKSAFLCGIMKMYRQKSKLGGSSSTTTTKGPDEDKIKEILDRTGYTLDVTTGQRKYGGPPPDWDGPQPGAGCEVFVGKIPKDLFEDELILLFEKCGKIWDLRLMMDPLSGQNRGYAFITYCNKDGAYNAVKELDNFEIRNGKYIGVTISINNNRLFVGNIPKNRGKDELFEEFTKHAPGLSDVIIYSSPDDKKKNRGFCFLEYESHKAASLAKRRLSTGRIKVWGCDIIIDWADPQEEPDEETMSKVKVLYARNLTAAVTEEKLKEMFENYGRVERVKKIKDYAFIHFEDRNNAVKAMNALNGKDVEGGNIEISLAKPPSDKKKKEEVLRNREKRMMGIMQQRSMMMGIPPQPRSRGGRMPPPGPRNYDYDYDYYGYGDYCGGYADPYYDDYYGPFDDFYDYDYDYGYVPPPPPPRTRGGPDRVHGGHGGMMLRGRTPGLGHPRGRVPATIPRGQGIRGVGRGATVGRGLATNRGGGRGNLAGKRKIDGGHQNQGDSKRRYHSTWGSQPIPQQPLSSGGYNSYGSLEGDSPWYQDSFGQQWG
ncbi:heterogeneous nuclear ribonucleoprotein R-like isoform X1 [Tachypleus tridentatus]|uniref:heterogeneous nuclear ribonucleoprotein R-like isoform X1 n=2 Tax=Tachypleus tridentatus TaxID=6853 RepID=UPI003FD2EE31